MQEKIFLTDVDEVLAGGPQENERVALCRIGEHEGIVDVDGHVIVPFKYSCINGYVWDSSGLLAVVNDEGMLGHVDIHGNEAIPCRFPFEVLVDAPYFCFCEGRFPIVDRNGLIGFIDTRGEVVIRGAFHRVRHFANGRCAVMNDQQKWGYIDASGNVVIDYRFEKAYDFDASGLAHVYAKVRRLWVFTSEVYATIDKQGKIV